ncbi:hypothetical protein cyc_02057 [Cyclospora cayetanensis]|uniref:Uncharacterized protein n=1 Tax=Cyclospora cayetanensis TaxID=88456 RepID=A0A1D3D3V9_9EIME|nr:hypothetical protein cyc_02057 [Cyclospora cayetanensis]
MPLLLTLGPPVLPAAGGDALIDAAPAGEAAASARAAAVSPTPGERGSAGKGLREQQEQQKREQARENEQLAKTSKGDSEPPRWLQLSGVLRSLGGSKQREPESAVQTELAPAAAATSDTSQKGACRNPMLFSFGAKAVPLRPPRCRCCRQGCYEGPSEPLLNGLPGSSLLHQHTQKKPHPGGLPLEDAVALWRASGCIRTYGNTLVTSLLAAAAPVAPSYKAPEGQGPEAAPEETSGGHVNKQPAVAAGEALRLAFDFRGCQLPTYQFTCPLLKHAQEEEQQRKLQPLPAKALRLVCRSKVTQRKGGKSRVLQQQQGAVAGLEASCSSF